MGSFLDKPKVEKTTEGAEHLGNKLKYGMSCMQGWRIDMEDAHSAVLAIDSAPEISWFAVFDGHGGQLVSRESSARVLDEITSTPEWVKSPRTTESITAALHKGFLNMDDALRNLADVKNGEDHSGSTAISSMVTPTHIIVANVGDSRSILVSDNKAIAMSEDHKPYNQAENDRIVKAGGSVSMRRVNGDLAVSRALGDFVYKHRQDLPAVEQQVSAEPEIQIHVRTPRDQYLVLACDGIWDVMSNEDVAEFIVKRAPNTQEEINKTCEEILDRCLDLGSKDNMSVVIVAFPDAGSIAAAAGGARPASDGGAGAAAASEGGSA